MIKNYIKTAWRHLLKNKVTTLINIVGLSVGMTAAVLIFLWVQNETSFDKFQPGSEKVYRLTSNLKANNWVWETTPLLLAAAAKKEIPELEEVARLSAGNASVFNINGKMSAEKNCAYVDNEWFRMFAHDFIKGSAASFEEDPHGVVLSASAEKKYFGSRDALGAVIRIDNEQYQVKAVIRDAASNSSFQYPVFLPLAALLANRERRENDEQWGNFNYLTFVRLKPNVAAESAAKKLTDVLEKNSHEQGVDISLIALQDMHFETGLQSSVFPHGSRNTVYIFSVLAILLLLVACINYVNLTTANASMRAKETSVRKMIGAARAQLVWQFITESILVSILAVFITLILVRLMLPAFNAFTGNHFLLPLTSPGLWRVTGFTLLTAVLLNSLYPAIMLSSFKPLDVFRGITVLKLKDSHFRKGLVSVQFCISIMLIAATIIIYRQMQFIQHSDPGYNRSQLLSFTGPMDIERERKPALLEAIKRDLQAQAGIESVTLANQPVVNIGSMSTGSADWEGHDTTFNPKIVQLSTDADFLKAMQVSMIEGRWFLPGNQSDKNNVVLNETAVRELGMHKPVVGQRFSFKGRKGQVIGVVKDFRYRSMHEKTGPLVAFNDPLWFNFFMVRISPGKASQAIRALQSTWNKYVPEAPLEYNFLDDSFNTLYKKDTQASYLTFVFAMLAIVISAMGLFGLAAFNAGQRTKEIGIRKVLGASLLNITSLLSKDFVKLVCISTLVASPVAWYVMNKWMMNFAYRVDISWWIFAIAGAIALLIALAITSFHSVKAGTANPVKSLRSE